MRGSEFGVKLGKSFWKKSVFSHGKKDARLAHHHDEHHGTETGDGTQLDKRTEPTETFSRAIDGQGNGGRYCEFLEGDDSGEDERDEDIEDGAEQKGAKNPKRHVTLWVFALLRRGGDSIKADVGEEDDSSTGEDTAPTVLAETSGVFGNEGDPVVGVDVGRAAENEEDDDGELDDDDDIVETGGFTDADHKQDGGGQADKDGGEVEEGSALSPDAVVEDQRGGAEGGWDIHAEVVEEFDGVAGPSDGDGGGGEQVFQNKVPSDDPGEEFSEAGVGVGVGATGGGNHGSVLGVAEAGKETANARDGEGKNECGSGVVCGSGAGEDEDSCADDGANAQEGELPGAEGFDESGLVFGLVLEVIDLFGSKEILKKGHGD